MEEFIKEFLATDCEQGAGRMILDDIRQDLAGGIRELREYAFNVFRVQIDYQRRTVEVEDMYAMLDPDRCSMSLADFQSILRAHAPPE